MKKILMCACILASGSLTVRAYESVSGLVITNINIIKKDLIPNVKLTKSQYEDAVKAASPGREKANWRTAVSSAGIDEVLAGLHSGTLGLLGHLDEGLAEVANTTNQLLERSRAYQVKFTTLERRITELEGRSKKVAHGKRRSRRRRA